VGHAGASENVDLLISGQWILIYSNDHHTKIAKHPETAKRPPRRRGGILNVPFVPAPRRLTLSADTYSDSVSAIRPERPPDSDTPTSLICGYREAGKGSSTPGANFATVVTWELQGTMLQFFQRSRNGCSTCLALSGGLGSGVDVHRASCSSGTWTIASRLQGGFVAAGLPGGTPWNRPGEVVLRPSVPHL